MAYPKRTEINIPVERVFLHHENPRHEPYETQAQVVEWLCSNEEVPQLARDIAQHGLSPFDRFGVKRDPEPQDGIEVDDSETTYVAAEGNRRLCALKLLNDPELAPPEKREYFRKLADRWSPITMIPCVVFEDDTDLDLWLKRRHHGTSGGVGQKPWNADQKARHSGAGSRNRVALAFFDYAEQENLISSDDRRRRLTTAQRFLGNPVMREVMGIDISDPDAVLRNRNDEDFKILSRQFIKDMTSGNPIVHSRQNSQAIIHYARELQATRGLSHERVEPEPLSEQDEKPKPKRRTKPGKPQKRQRIPWDGEIASALKGIDNWKLTSLYHSICDIALDDNVPLLAVGVWSFMETLTAHAGRSDSTDFYSFLSPQRLANYGLGGKTQTGSLRDAVQRVQRFGNTTKHHDVAAAFNGDQLANDVEALEPLILKLIEDAASG